MAFPLDLFIPVSTSDITSLLVSHSTAMFGQKISSVSDISSPFGVSAAAELLIKYGGFDYTDYNGQYLINGWDSKYYRRRGKGRYKKAKQESGTRDVRIYSLYPFFIERNYFKNYSLLRK